MPRVTTIFAAALLCASGIAQSKPYLALQIATFDPLAGEPQIPDALRANALTTLWVVQFTNTPTESGRQAIRDQGAEIHGYLPHNAHVIRADATSVQAIARQQGVRWVGHYHPAYRLEPFLVDELLADEGKTRTYNLILVDKHRDRPALGRAITALGGTVTNEHPGSLLLEARLTRKQLQLAAGLNQVLWIDRVQPRGVDMNNARTQSGADYIETVAGYTGQGVHGHIYEGIEATHPDFTTTPTVVQSCPTPNDHGHATAGIVFGNGQSHQNARGIAPDLVPFYTNDLCQTPGMSRWQVVQDLIATHEVMFTTSSWGNGVSTTYNSFSADADDIVFDHGIAWTQSMSNSGNRLSRPQAWAKNVFSIGGVRHFDNLDPNDDSWSGGGSIGPASDNRIKPELCAYYDMTWTSDLTGVAGYTNDDHVSDFGGTSGATPMVAGLNALAIQMYTDGLFGPVRVPGGSRFANRPSFTTLKALQIVGARQYAFQAGSTDNRREHQGFGFPNMQDLYDDRSLIHVVDETDPLLQGEVKRYRIQTAPGRNSLKISMSFADPAAIPTAAITAVNDLTLRVIAPDGTVYWGNHGLDNGMFSVGGGQASTVDTVECVLINQPIAGIWNVDVVADRVAADSHLASAAVDADFGLVVRGGTFQGLGTPGQALTFGAGCLGSRPSPPATCLAINDTQSRSSVTVGPSTIYAFEMTAPTDLEVTGFQIFANTTIAQSQTLIAAIRYPDASGRPNIVASSGTITIGATPEFYEASIAPITIPAGQRFFVSCNTPPVNPPALWAAAAGGTPVSYYRHSNGAWSPLVTGLFAWSVRIQCQPSTTQIPRIEVDGIFDLGQTYQVATHDMASNNLAAILFGVSNTEFTPTTLLPFSLTPLGAPGCTVLVSSEVLILGLSQPDGSFETNIVVPLLPAFLGTQLYHQGLVLDQPANSLGFVLSNAVEITLGG